MLTTARAPLRYHPNPEDEMTNSMRTHFRWLPLLLLVAVNRQKRTQQREVTSRMFFEYADKRGLSTRECRVLTEIAKRAGIKQKSRGLLPRTAGFDRVGWWSHAGGHTFPGGRI